MRWQDTFLPHVERGTVILVGATTENPSFHINSALLSRCQVVVLEKLSVDNLQVIVDRAVLQLGITKLTSSSEAPASTYIFYALCLISSIEAANNSVYWSHEGWESIDVYADDWLSAIEVEMRLSFSLELLVT